VTAKRGRTIADFGLFGGFGVSGTSPPPTFVGGIVQLRLASRGKELSLMGRMLSLALSNRSGLLATEGRIGKIELASRAGLLGLPEK
jgi:hypothetical protein